MVAVDAIILALTPLFAHNLSTTVSYRPTIVPSGPEIRCNSS